MLISTIIPVYNAEKFLAKCLDSIINAQYDGLENEIILVNDGSMDNSQNICEDYVKRNHNIRLYTQLNQGPSAARNLGINEAKGKYITFVDSDDYVEEKYFQVLTNSISKFPNSDILVFNYFKTTDIQIERFPYHKYGTRLNHDSILEVLKNTIEFDYLLYPFNKLYCNNLLKNNFLQFDNKIRLGEDSIFNLKAFYYSKEIVFINESVYNYFTNVESVTNQKYRSDISNAMEIHFKEKLNFYKSHNEMNQLKYFQEIGRVNLQKTFYTLLSNVLANKDLDFCKELEMIRELDLIKFGFEVTDFRRIRSGKSRITLFLFKYRQFQILKFIYK